jgi:indole-3-glycerol phosphate synthase
MQAGASALSILTDKEFFGGNNEDLMVARKFNYCPILRKDFTIDEYQIIEAKSIGADAILLIAAILEPTQARQLASFAHSLGLEVLLEVHSAEELHQQLFSEVDLIGVNNRDLKSFEVSLDVSRKLVGMIPEEMVKISESGISSTEAIDELRAIGFDGFLMGENFMKHSRPEVAAKEFIGKLRIRK